MMRFLPTLAGVGYFLAFFCMPLVAVSTPGDAKIQFSNEKTFDRIYFEFEKPTKFRSQKFSSQILIEFNSPVANKFEKRKGDLGKYIKGFLLQDEGREAVVTMQDKLNTKCIGLLTK